MGEQIYLTGGPLTGLRETGAYGRPLHMLYPQLVDCLRAELGNEAALYLAEPVVDTRRSEVDWYANVDGTIVAYNSLGPEDQQRLGLAVGQRLDQIEALADRLAASPDPGRQQLASLLHTAAAPPMPENVFFVDGRIPVAAFWGFLNDDAYATATDLRVRWWPEPANSEPIGTEPAAVDPVSEAGDNGRQADETHPHVPDNAGDFRQGSGGRHEILHDVHRVVERLGYTQRLRLIGTTIFWGAAIASALTFMLLGGARAMGLLPAVVETVLEPSFTELEQAKRRESALRQTLAAVSQDFHGRRLSCPLPQPIAAASPSREEVDSRLREANAVQGAISIALQWEGKNDLDLQVVCPNGDVIYYDRKIACGGILDVDKNVGESNATDRPVEHIVWQQGAASPGMYKIKVHYHKKQSDREETPFTVFLDQGAERKEFRDNARVVKFDIDVAEFEVR